MSDDLERCYVAAMRILQYRFNSEAELRRKLQRKQFTAELIDPTIERLRHELWIDDARFAGSFVRTRQLKRIGPRRIARELGAAGVDEDTARHAVRQHADPERERADLESLCRKRHLVLVRRKGAEYAASGEGRNKLTVYLLNQGYDGALVREVVTQVLRAFASS